MDPRAGFDRLVALVTFSGSLLSFIATSTVLGAYVYYRHEQRSFRHALVFNLALAEFINTLNNTISGIIFLRDKALYPGAACTLNGFFGQLSVQAADFSILVIALVTLLTITRTTYMPAASSLRKTLICLSVWVAPLITASVATGLGAMGPVSGNWCWIMSTRTDLRYALTHGWRIAIIFVTSGIYLFVWWYMNRHFRSMVSTMTSSGGSGSGRGRGGSWSSRRRGFRRMRDGRGKEEHKGARAEDEDTELSTVSKSRISRVGDDDWELSAPEAAYAREAGREDDDADEEREIGGRGGDHHHHQQRRMRRRDSICSISDDEDHRNYGGDDDKAAMHVQIRDGGGPGYNRDGGGGDLNAGGRRFGDRKAERLMTTDTAVSEFPTRKRTRDMEREIKRMLLLNAYPIMYVLLWVPGLVNRFMEATGNKSDSRALAALQASSQFVGLANALTYGFNKGLRKKVQSWWGGGGGGGRRR